MRLVPRSLSTLALVFGAVSSPLAAQASPPSENYRFSIGAQGGVTVFSTPGQTRGGIPMAGGNLLIKAKRTGLMITVQEGFGSGEQSSFVSPSLGTSETVVFNDMRTFAFHLMAFPVRSAAQPYFGIGAGLVNVISPTSNNTLLTLQDAQTVALEADDISTTGFLSAVGGVNFNVGRLSAFGQYMYTSPASRGKLLRGPTHTLAAGLRFNLGSSRGSLQGGGY